MVFVIAFILLSVLSWVLIHLLRSNFPRWRYSVIFITVQMIFGMAINSLLEVRYTSPSRIPL